jgi:septum formation protein
MPMKPTQPLVLASNSPRRQQLLQQLGWTFTVRTKDTSEDFPADMPAHQVPLYLAEKKAEAFRSELKNEMLVTADTVVIVEGRILNKPADEREASDMLSLLSGKMHQVVTGVCVLSADRKELSSDLTEVYFRILTSEEIHFYIQGWKPFDKAGGYGAQEWMGMVAVEKIVGSYFNVMGLPVHRLYQVLNTFGK